MLTMRHSFNLRIIYVNHGYQWGFLVSQKRFNPELKGNDQ